MNRALYAITPVALTFCGVSAMRMSMTAAALPWGGLGVTLGIACILIAGVIIGRRGA